MIHPVDAPLVFASRRHGGSEQGDVTVGRRTVYSARSTDTGPIPTSPQIRDDYRPVTAWSQLYRSGRMPVTTDQKPAGDQYESIDSNVTGMVAAAGTIKTTRKSDTLHFPAPVQTPSLEAPLELKSADLNIGSNCKAHHTETYFVTQRIKGPQLVLRRGADFVVHLTFYRPYDPAHDNLRLVFEIGDMPTIANLTKIIVPVISREENGEKAASAWSAVIEGTEENRLSLRVKVAPNAIVGCWNVKIVSSLKHQPTAGFLDSVSLIHGVYILFNPWSADDPTYLENDQERDEYVLNDSGKIWRGSHNSLRPTYWNFGQFEPGVLESCIYILDRSRLPYPQRASPLQIARLIAQVVNSVDGNGVLVGNWSNDFSGGVPPTEWTGSPRILRQYAETGQPVFYGQCWVFAGVVTTILRSLGIPSRVVTNYASAHDSGTTVTIDLHVNNSGKIDRQHTTDSLWTYHAWNECWFSRPDLPRGYGGWQAIDATPQEKSDGLYRVGPTSVTALREGQVGFAYDTAYLFAEVNAEKCYWLMSEDNSERLIDVRPSEIGQCISTKRPGRKITGMNNDDRLDISQLYKFQSDKPDGKRAVLDALLPGHCEHTRSADQQRNNDVEMQWAMNKPVRIGDDFEVAVSITNNAKQERTVKISLRIESMQYFGGEMHKIRSETKAITLPPGGKQEAKMNVSLRDYLSKAMPQFAFMLTSLARVVQTGQIFLSTDDFRVKMPNVTIRAPEKLQAGQPTSVVLEFINPLPVMLTHCKFLIDGPGVITSTAVPCRDVSPRGSAKAECQLTPWRSGRDFVLVAHFSSDQLQDIDGATSVDVISK